MIDNWFTNKCMALVGSNGRTLVGEALEIAEQALQDAKNANHKIWSDRSGNFFHKERKLFAPVLPLIDASGNQVRICGRRVKVKAKFCSKCGSAAPGSWWRCGGCGKMIGHESKACPHCGRVQNPVMRLDINNGSWRKDEDIFAQRFEVEDIISLIPRGLNIQESQNAILLDGGAVVDVLESGAWQSEGMDESSIGERSIVMVDSSEFILPVCVENVRTLDDIEANLHAVVVLRFDPANAREFMANLMGSSLYLQNDALTASLGYDEIAHCLIADVDASAREFCNTVTVSDLFKSADSRIKLEDHISSQLQRNLSAIGMKFVRLQEVEFDSELFDKLRTMSGDLEKRRKEIEFMQRSDALINDATRRDAMSEFEMEDFMNQLAQEKEIKDELRLQEIERIKVSWGKQTEKEDLEHEHDLDDIQQKRQLDRDRIDAEFKEEMIDLEHRKELERRIAEQVSSLEYTKLESQIQVLKLDIEKKKVAAEQEATEKWIELQQKKEAFAHNLYLEKMKAASGATTQALLAVTDDSGKRRDLLALNEQQLQSTMTPELLLAAAAARGNAAAAEALSRLNKDQIEVIERFKNENKDIFEQMLQMNERMFNQATESMAKRSENSSSTTTTQIIK